MSLTAGIATRLEVTDPGFVRTRRAGRAACATVLAWATMLAVTTAFDVTDPQRITLFAAGAAFEGALLAPDPKPQDRLRTLGWAALVSAATVVIAVQLSQFAMWSAAAWLIGLIFLSYALRAWSPRMASLALMGAITTYVTGAGHIATGRIGWFVLALAVGFGWIALWENVIVPDDPVQSLRKSVQAFLRRTADAVGAVAEVLTTNDGAIPSARSLESARRHLARVRKCRAAIDPQFPGAALRGVNQTDLDELAVALYSTQRGVEDMVEAVQDPQWMQELPDNIRCSITDTLSALVNTLRGDLAPDLHNDAAVKAEELRGHIHNASTPAEGPSQTAPDATLAALTLIGGALVITQSSSQATALVTGTPNEPSIDRAERSSVAAAPASRGLSPTMALAIQAVIAAVSAGLIARIVGNEQSLVVAWTAFVVIGGSAGASTRRAWARLPATIVGAIAGVAIAASFPDTLFWTVAIVAVGVFFTIASAPVSYPAMVFWLSIALVPLFATEGQYLDLIRDKGVAALLGGGVAAIVALSVAPIRVGRNVRPAVIAYLDALDNALASHLVGPHADIATAEAALDRAHSSLEAILRTAATETQLLPQSGNPLGEQGIRVDAVHDAYLRLTPLLSGPARRLHGWSDQRIELGVSRLRDDVKVARAAASDNPIEADDSIPTVDARANDTTSLQVSDSLRRIANLRSRLAELTKLLGDGSLPRESLR